MSTLPSSDDGKAPARHLALFTGGSLGSIVGALASVKMMSTFEAYSYLTSRQWALLSDHVALHAPTPILAGLLFGMASGFALSRTLPALRIPTFVRTAIVSMGALVLCGTAAAYVNAGMRHVPDGPNVLVVVMDTTRPDHLSLYGYERKTTPNLDRIASSSTVFTRAYSTSSWTAPAHASLFTGLYPGTHGVTQESWNMRREHVTLAETFWESGYRTFGAVGNPNVSTKMYFDQGFDIFRETWLEEVANDSATHPAVRHFKAMLDSDSERPFFAFINLMEPHSPYVDGPHLARFDPDTGSDLDRNDFQNFFMGNRQFSEEDLKRLRDLYDAEILYSDEVIGRLIEELEQREIFDDTILVVTSDHGEHFGDHDLVDHVFNLYEGNVRVPLLIRYPGSIASGRVDDAPVQLHDLFPTLLSLSGNMQAIDSITLEGQDVFGSDGIDPMRPIVLSYGYPIQVLQSFGDDHDAMELAPYRRRLWGLRQGDMKIILGDDGSLEAYDLSADPNELRDLSAEDELRDSISSLAENLHAVAQITTQEAPVMPKSNPEADLDEETKRQLRSLGYLAPE